jgi:hypothetical protein
MEFAVRRSKPRSHAQGEKPAEGQMSRDETRDLELNSRVPQADLCCLCRRPGEQSHLEQRPTGHARTLQIWAYARAAGRSAMRQTRTG